MSGPGSPPARVAIVGGGCAGMAAAWELSHPRHGGRFAVTVYQQGWRLGGKGASGRGPAGRVEEHGLHLWMGYYENAFRMMRECYDELDRDPALVPLAGWRDAFERLPAVGVTEGGDGAGWATWLAQFPDDAGEPGEADGRPFDPGQYVRRLVDLAATLVTSATAAGARDWSSLAAAPAALAAAGVVQSVEAVRSLLGRSSDSVRDDALDAALAGLTDAARRAIRPLVARDPALRRVWEIVDVTLGNARGIVADRLLANPQGFDAINHLDYREWLAGHGVAAESLDSAVIRGLYDLAFAYENADVQRPRFAAGQALRSALRAFFTYRGAVFWRMNAGMGDVVFAPLYEVLGRRGVRFEFFHRLRHVALGDDGGAHVRALAFDVQARPAGDAYEPLTEVRGLPTWPSMPRFEQLSDGEALRAAMTGAAVNIEAADDTYAVAERVLEVGRDFDFVVLAVGLGAIPLVCSEILARDERWRRMTECVQTVATQSFQVWMRESTADLGWGRGPAAVSGFVEPFDTWADMSHLVPVENWSEPVRSIAYFCSVLPDGEVAGQDPAEVVYRGAARFLDHDVAALWPRAAAPGGGFRWDLLVNPEGRPVPATEDALRSQYWRANVHPSDRYVLSLPGTIDARISPLDGTYDNLTVAGDWTDCGHNCGCVEAAVMSGRLAAHALSGSPPLEAITGFDHP